MCSNNPISEKLEPKRRNLHNFFSIGKISLSNHSALLYIVFFFLFARNFIKRKNPSPIFLLLIFSQTNGEKEKANWQFHFNRNFQSSLKLPHRITSLVISKKIKGTGRVGRGGLERYKSGLGAWNGRKGNERGHEDFFAVSKSIARVGPRVNLSKFVPIRFMSATPRDRDPLPYVHNASEMPLTTVLPRIYPP